MGRLYAHSNNESLHFTINVYFGLSMFHMIKSQEKEGRTSEAWRKKIPSTKLRNLEIEL